MFAQKRSNNEKKTIYCKKKKIHNRYTTCECGSISNFNRRVIFMQLLITAQSN